MSYERERDRIGRKPELETERRNLTKEERSVEGWELCFTENVVYT